MIPPPPITEFRSAESTYLGRTRTVYKIGTIGPGLILLHDVPGITPNVLRLAMLLAGQNFRVVIPSLFGSDGASVSRVNKAVLSAQLVAGSDFAISPEDRSSTVVDWLRELAKDYSQETQGPIGAIGLGVTGAFALSLSVGTDGLVVAAVLGNPVVPSIAKKCRETNLTAVEEENLRARRPATLALRFAGDPLCRAERFDAYRALLGDRFTAIEIPSPHQTRNNDTDGHSVLTEGLSDSAGQPTWKAFTEVVRFLQATLTTEHKGCSVDIQPMDRLTGFADVLRHELKVILNVDLPPRSPATLAEGEFEKQVLQAVDSESDLSALCLSGGGIRSATFALGVMQALARFGLLGKFHYLSSVSGGGYIAGWLSAWRTLVADDEVLKALNQSMQTGKEPAEITGIRKDSNYLTPQLGLLSADTWTVIALYIRNLLLNWLIFAPFFLGCFMAPRLCVAVLVYAGQPWDAAEAFNVSRILGAVLVLTGLSVAIYGRFRKADQWLTDLRFQWWVLLPLVLSGACFTVAAVVLGVTPNLRQADHFFAHHLRLGAEYGALIYFVAWVIGRVSSLPKTDGDEKTIEKRDVVYWTLSGSLVGLLAAAGMNAIAAQFTQGVFLQSFQIAETLGLSGFTLAYLVGELLYVGIASFSAKGDMDREWLARSSGWLSATAVLWTIGSAIALYAPDFLVSEWTKTLAAVGGVSGLITAMLGSSSRTGATKALQSLKKVPLMRIVTVAAILFALALASVFSFLDEEIETFLAVAFRSSASTAVLDSAVVILSIAFALGVSYFINVNRFSLHALYRNRLVRAFVGSARGEKRKPDPFTRFDPKDNLALTDIEPMGAVHGHNNLFHVINAALNVVHSDNEAWQERKAESFTMTRLFCGNSYVGYRPSHTYGGREKRGLTLGTAMAISGAAVSPNQGYNSSPLTGFLLMLFNIRLGWWLGSPKRSCYDDEGPTCSLTPALRELGGDTTDKSKWIYLSDGGHFENLGLYEMVRRRCRTIVVSDAGCDPTCSFEDLGNAVRKIFIDFGVSINFDKLEIKARQTPPTPGIRFAVGSIKYPGSDREGWLLYLKPTYMATDERADVRSYASANPQFPHESTADQWFSESQLESYRALGASITEYVCSGGAGVASGKTPDPVDFKALQGIAEKLLKRVILELEASGPSNYQAL